MPEYVDITIEFRTEAHDIKEAIENVEDELGESDDLAIDWPTIVRAEIANP